MIPYSVVMTTYLKEGTTERTQVANRTLQGLIKYLQPPPVLWVVADDGSPPEHIKVLLANFTDQHEVKVTNANRGGVGKSKNIALWEAFQNNPVVLLLEDDWLLESPLDISEYLDILDKHADLGMIRLGYLGGNMMAERVDYGDFRAYWCLVPNSGLYVYSGQISLRHHRYYIKMGPHKEGVPAGVEEEEMCHRYNQTEDPPKILFPTSFGSRLNDGPFRNIGMETSTNAEEPTNVT